MKPASATPEKQKSKPLGKFLIYIQEDENGHIWIQADSIGVPGLAFNVGYEIISNLLAAEAQNPTRLTVGDLMISSGFQ